MLKKRIRILAMVLILSLILPGMEQGIPGVVKAAAEDSLPNGPSKNEDGIMTWDSIYFGKYWQRDTNGDGSVDQKDEKEPIKWRVLSVEGNDAFLLADQPLDCRKYSGDQNDVSLDENYEEGLSATWEDCSLRTWLNETFYQDAFSEEEGAAIQTVTVTNEDSLVSGIEGGNDTQDKVYLLSLTEVIRSRYGFLPSIGESVERAAAGTKYAENNDIMDFDLDSYWWLRTPGDSQTSAAVISPSGQIGANGMPVDFAPLGVRPVLHMDLGASSVWESAGTVTGVQPATPSEEPAVTSKPVTPSKEPAVTSKPTPTATPKPTAKPAPTTTMQPGKKKAISSFKDLQAMEEIPSGNYYLTKDITVPANTHLFQDYPFTGMLDGKGHKIKGFQVQKKFVFNGKVIDGDFSASADASEKFPEDASVGLFSQAQGATFQNLSLTDVNINVQTEAYAAVGALVTMAGGATFNNIHVSGKISVQSIRENPIMGLGSTVGGIVGTDGGNMTNCSNSASISVNCKSGEYAGGLSVGGLAGGSCGKMTKCSNSGNISVKGYCKGYINGWMMMEVAGLVREADSVTSCKNTGNVSLTALKDGNFISRVAGIAINVPVIKSSGNTGKISLQTDDSGDGSLDAEETEEVGQELAGVACNIGTAQRCYNKGSVKSDPSGKGGLSLIAGGLFAICDTLDNYQVSECYNTGKVTVKAKKGRCFAGGIAGLADAETGKIQNCYNAGKISVKGVVGGCVGGILGVYINYRQPKGMIRYNYNVGKITAKKCHKGVILGVWDTTATEYLVKAIVRDNYYKGSGKVCGYYGCPKKYVPKGKKVSAIKKGKCPKLSSKYWVYSSKVKRLILKNNKETNLGIKKAKKKSSKKK